MVFAGCTESKYRNQINDGSQVTRRNNAPILYTLCDGDDDFFDAKIPEEYLKESYDKNGDLRYYKVQKWSLPGFGQERYW